MLDWIIIEIHPEGLASSDLQFAYKAKSSTTQCTFAVNEVIKYYNTSGSNVHAILLDATKAFDRVQYVKLFKELLRKGLCPTVCKFLALQYVNQLCQVKWGNHISDVFHISNGVKQGGVLSPILFTIYMDVLLERLRESAIGCHIGITFAAAFAYADDIILLGPTRSSIEKLIEVCEQFSKNFSISFNGNKSKHLYFGINNNESYVTFSMQGHRIPKVDNDYHLGNLIGKQTLD